MKISLNFSEPQEVSYDFVIQQFASIADLQTIQKSTKDIIGKYQNNGTKPIDLVLFADIDIGLQGTYYDYAVLYQMIQGKIKELRNEIKNTV